VQQKDRDRRDVLLEAGPGGVGFLSEHSSREDGEEWSADHQQDRRGEQTSVLAGSVMGGEEALHLPGERRHQHDVQPVPGDQRPARADPRPAHQGLWCVEQAGHGEGDQGPDEDEGFGGGVLGSGPPEEFRGRRRQQEGQNQGSSSRRNVRHDARRFGSPGRFLVRRRFARPRRRGHPCLFLSRGAPANHMELRDARWSPAKPVGPANLPVPPLPPALRNYTRAACVTPAAAKRIRSPWSPPRPTTARGEDAPRSTPGPDDGRSPEAVTPPDPRRVQSPGPVQGPGPSQAVP
jgi:hypothetical protein